MSNINKSKQLFFNFDYAKFCAKVEARTRRYLGAIREEILEEAPMLRQEMQAAGQKFCITPMLIKREPVEAEVLEEVERGKWELVPLFIATLIMNSVADPSMVAVEEEEEAQDGRMKLRSGRRIAFRPPNTLKRK